MTSASPDLKDVMAAIGEVMLRWGFLESVMLDRLGNVGVELHATAPPIQQWRRACIGVGQPFALWLGEIEQAAAIRNLLAHGLCEARSLPTPEVRCRQAGGESVTLSLQQLQDAAQTIDLLRCRLVGEPAWA